MWEDLDQKRIYMLREIGHISASGVIYPASDPRTIFVEFRGGRYPVRAFQNSLNCLGGNWIGDDAKNDHSPRDTFLREIGAELSFEKTPQSRDELVALNLLEQGASYRATACIKCPAKDDREKLAMVKAAIVQYARHFGDNIQRISRSVFDRADPDNTRPDMTYLNSFFAVPLPVVEWQMLAELQAAFGNLSNESTSIITTVGEVVERKRLCAWSYDRILQTFWGEHHISEARNMPLVPGIEIEWLIDGNHAYEDYLKRFASVRHP